VKSRARNKKRKAVLTLPSLFPLALAKKLIFSGGNNDSSVPRASPGSCCSTLLPHDGEEAFPRQTASKARSRPFPCSELQIPPAPSTRPRCSDLRDSSSGSGRGGGTWSCAMGPTVGAGEDKAISELREQHRVDLERLTITSRPFKTLAFFVLAIAQSLERTCSSVLKKGYRLKIAMPLVAVTWVLLLFTDGLHEKHLQELLWYVRFGLWWIILGVASSIGLGSGLHTFIMYLGPHVALFTIKAVQCGRVDLKSAPYDTILLKRSPSWLEKDCLQFGPPIYHETIPFSKILQEVCLEAVLWGIGTALGELPPYFLSRAGFVHTALCTTIV